MTPRTALALLIAFLLACPGPAAAAGTDSRTLRVVHFGSLDGAFAAVGCRAEDRGKVDFSNFLHEVLELRAGGNTVVLSTGNVLGDAPFFDFLLKQGESGLATLAAMLERSGVALFTPGVSELSVPYRMFLEFLPDFDKLGIRFRAANLTCDEAAPPGCRTLASDAARIVEVDGLRIGIVPLLGPGIVRVVHPLNATGLKLSDPAETANREAERLRLAGADLVIALVNLEAEPGGTEETVPFAGKLKGVDLVVAGGLVPPSDREAALNSARIGRRSVLVVGTPRAPLSLGLVTLRLLRKGNRWRVDDARAETRRVGSFRRHQETSVLLAQAVSEFCSVGQRVLGSGRVDPPLDRTGFVRYVLEVVRRELRTDLAVVSEDSLTMGPEERLEGPVTSGFLTRSFARNEMVELSVLGQDLGGFVSAYHAASNGALRGRLHLVGARVLADGTVEVNNRPLNAKRRYTIAATDFLASGGRSYLSGLLAAEATRRTPTRYFLQELVLRFFDKDRFATEPGDRTIALDRNFADLWDRPLWEFSLGLNGSVSNVSIENPAEYAETQLTSRSPNTGVKGDGQFLVTISTRDHRVSDFLKAQYGMVQVGEGPFDETQDLITEEILYSWTRWRNRTGEGRFWIPAPLVKGKLETEFSGAPTTWAKDGDGNEILDAEGLKVPEFEPYHHLEVTGVAGIEWLFGSKASAGLGYGFRSELLATEGSGRDGVHAGVEVYYQINKLPLYSWSAVSGITLDSRFELFLSDWTDERTLKSSGSTRLVASVLGPLSFTLGFDFFLFRTGDEGLAYAFDTTVGLAFSYDAAVQQF